jgi:hypothetical protein
MQHSSVLSFLTGEKPADEFWLEIEAEVTKCVTATSTIGGVGYVVISEGPNATIERRHVDVLVDALAKGTLPIQAAAYVADALIMSDSFDFADDGVSDAVSFLSDESRPLSREDVQLLQEQLSPMRFAFGEHVEKKE